ncbi:Ig-like domain-containing protein [candidate division TA06 bacterium]|uniref:Ig-like domain-containing protein n=1 Tax=candidate division TA06 bacterium TaxID=2250710 RepID=A0A933MK71_UNCT6|nr:Ig-like domain-containing protein [candidate division TA06 bacterium]
MNKQPLLARLFLRSLFVFCLLPALSTAATINLNANDSLTAAGAWSNVPYCYADDALYTVGLGAANGLKNFRVGLADPVDTVNQAITGVVIYVKGYSNNARAKVRLIPYFAGTAGISSANYAFGVTEATKSYDITLQDSTLSDSTWNWDDVANLSVQFTPKTAATFYVNHIFAMVTSVDTLNLLQKHYFVFNAIATPETLGLYFPVVISARTIPGDTVMSSYNNTAGLTDILTGATTPNIVTFTAGLCSVQVMISQDTVNTALLVSDGDTSGTSNQFDVINPGLHHFGFDSVGSQAAGAAFPVNIAALDFYGDTVTTFADKADLWDFTGALTPDSSGAFVNGKWTGNVTIPVVIPSDTLYCSRTIGGRTYSGKSNGFAVVDATPPVISSNSPTDGAVNVALNVPVSITFSEPIKKSTFAYTCTPDPGGRSESWNVDSTQVTINHTDFASLTAYVVKVTTAQDTAGNGLTGRDTIRFTTLDASLPYIVSNTPADGVTGVALNAAVSITFSEPIKKSAFAYTFTPDPGGRSESWNVDSTQVTINHTDFASLTAYVVKVTTAQDTAGNGLTGRDTIRFTTLDASLPYIVSNSPADGATGVALNAAVSITFSEPIETTTFAYTFMPDPGGRSETWNVDSTQVTINHTDFVSLTAYVVKVTTAQDVAGNGLTGRDSLKFTTLDATPPYIVSTSPADGAINVALNAPVLIVFSEPMDTASLAFSCPGVIWNDTVWGVTLDTVALSHTDFSATTAYTFTVTSAMDEAGNDLAGSNSFSFNTVLGVTGIPDGERTPFFLANANPNPVAGGNARFEFGIPAAGQVSLEIFNVIGQKIKTLVNGKLGAGRHAIMWNGRYDNGRRVPSGVFIYRLSADGKTAAKKLTIIR